MGKTYIFKGSKYTLLIEEIASSEDIRILTERGEYPINRRRFTCLKFIAPGRTYWKRTESRREFHIPNSLIDQLVEVVKDEKKDSNLSIPEGYRLA